MKKQPPRHLDQATSSVIRTATAEALDEELARQVEQHKNEPISAVLREVADEARRWAARMEPALPEHGGRGEAIPVEVVPAHEDLIDEAPAKRNGHRKPKPNGVASSNGTGG